MQPPTIHIIKQKQPFVRTYKKLQAAKKKLVNEAILTIDKNPEVGTEKKQDLKGIYVYKFKIDNTLMPQNTNLNFIRRTRKLLPRFEKIFK